MLPQAGGRRASPTSPTHWQSTDGRAITEIYRIFIGGKVNRAPVRLVLQMSMYCPAMPDARADQHVGLTPPSMSGARVDENESSQPSVATLNLQC